MRIYSRIETGVRLKVGGCKLFAAFDFFNLQPVICTLPIEKYCHRD